MIVAIYFGNPAPESIPESTAMGKLATWLWRVKFHAGHGFQWLEQHGLRGFRPSSTACISFTYLFREVRDYREAVMSYYGQKRSDLHFLSVGCSTGQEPFSIALMCEREGIPCSVTGIDLSLRAITIARCGTLNLQRERMTAQAELVEDPSSGAAEALQLLDECTGHFEPFAPSSHQVTLKREVRDRVRFERMDVCDMKFCNQFDFIICRKMLYYLPGANQTIAIAKMRAALKNDAPLSNIIFDGYTIKQPFFAELGLAGQNSCVRAANRGQGDIQTC